MVGVFECCCNRRMGDILTLAKVVVTGQDVGDADIDADVALRRRQKPAQRERDECVDVQTHV